MRVSDLPAMSLLGGPIEDRSPLVTIGMPVFDGAAHLEEAVRSLLDQTEGDFVLLISDNCSTDETPEICARLGAEDPRIRYVRQESNIGAVRNFEYVLQMAETPYFMWVAHDDIRAPGFLATSLKLLREAPDAVACSVGARVIDENGSEIDRILPPHALSSARPLERARAVSKRGQMAIYGLLRREAVPAGVRIGYFRGSDIAFVFSMALQRRIATTDELLITYRLMDIETKSRGPDARLYDAMRTPTAAYASMMTEVGRSSLPVVTTTQLRLHLAARWLGAARHAASSRNMRKIHRARISQRWWAVILRVPMQLVLGPGHLLAGLCRALLPATRP